MGGVVAGEVTLLRGDCIEAMGGLPDASVDMVLADPPYGTTRNRWDSVIPFDAMWGQVWRVARETAPVLLFSQQPFASALGASDIENLRYEWVWRKTQGTGFLNANRAPMKIHENVLVFYRHLPTYHPQRWDAGRPWHGMGVANRGSTNYGDYDVNEKRTDPTTTMRYPVDVVTYQNVGRGMRDAHHPTQKPVELLEYLIRTYTDAGGVVLDFCMGSGSTGVACLRTGRKFVGIELDDHWFDVASERIEMEAGQLRMPV